MAWLVALLAASCAPSQPDARDPEGAVRFPLASEAERRIEGGKIAWELENNDVTVTLQRIARDDRLLRGRKLEQVADAIVTRFELADFDAEMTHSACTVAGASGYCLDGTMDTGRGQLVRRGVLVPAGEEFLLIEALGPREHQTAVYTQTRLVQDRLERIGQDG